MGERNSHGKADHYRRSQDASLRGIENQRGFSSNVVAPHTSKWDMVYFRVNEYIAQNDRVVALGEVSFRHKKSGKIAVTPKTDIHRLCDGKICEFFEFYDTADAIAATVI